MTIRGKPASWTTKTVLTTLISSVAGFWLPDGISLIADMLDKQVAIDLSTRIESCIIIVAFTLILEQAHMTSERLSAQGDYLREILPQAINDHLSSGVKDMMASAQLVALTNNPQGTAIRDLLLELSGLLQPVASLPEPLRSGVATWMKPPLDQYRRTMRDILGNGVPASLSEHVAVTRSILDAGARQYLQVNLFAYDVATEWSRDWKEMLLHLHSSSKAISYIVFADQSYLQENQAKLESMDRYLRNCGGRLLTCDRDLVTDSFGDVTLPYNLELFDNLVVKTQSPSPTGYRGGITLTMSLALVEDRPDLMRMISHITQSSVAFRSEQ